MRAYPESEFDGYLHRLVRLTWEIEPQEAATVFCLAYPRPERRGLRLKAWITNGFARCRGGLTFHAGSSRHLGQVLGTQSL
jgi:hypothetical protein